MKKALYQSKRCVNSKSFTFRNDGYNSLLSKNIFEQNIKSCSSSSLIPTLYNVENQSKIIQTGNKFNQNNENFKEEIEDEVVEELNPKTWGRTIIIFNRMNTPKHLKNQYRLKIKEKYVYKNNMERIESLPWSFTNKEVCPTDCQIEPGHGKFSIVFKHTGKWKKTKTEIIKKVLIPKKESVEGQKVTEIKELQNLVVSKDPVSDKCAPILETAKIFKQNKDSDEFVGKVTIKFNRSNKCKSRCENQIQEKKDQDTTLEDMRKDLEKLNQMTKNSINDTAYSDEIIKISEVSIKIGAMNKSLNKGKIHVVFNHEKKAKRLKQLRKHFAPQIAKINQIKKTMDKKKEPDTKSQKVTKITKEKAPIVEADEKTLIDEIMMDLSEINNQAIERSKNFNNIKISVTQPRNEKSKLSPSKVSLLESCEWLDKRGELEKLNNVVDKNQKEALRNAMAMSHRKGIKKKRTKIWKSSATRIIMEKTKQSLDRLIMMNSDPQCGFVTGIPDLTRSMAVWKDLSVNNKTKPKETTVQTFVFEEPASNVEKHKPEDTKSTKAKTVEDLDDIVPNLNDSCVPEYIKMVGDKFTLELDNDELLKPKEHSVEFNKLLSDPSEIGALSINSTRAGETLENDRINKKLNFSIGEIKPLENVREIGRKLKSESIKESHGFNEKEKNEQFQENFHNSWHTFNADPLELKQFLKVVSNLFENNVDVNNEIIDDLVSFTSVNTCQTNTINKVTNQSESKNESKSTETRDQLYQILKNHSLDGESCSSLEVTKMSQCLEMTPDKKKKNEETPKLDTLKKSVAPISINIVNEDKELIKENPKTKRTTGLTTVKNYFETLRTEAKLTVTEAISRNLAKERMKVYKEFSQKFEKMGLYKKQPKKILIEGLKEGLKEDAKKKTPLNPIKKEIELQDKFKNTPEGKKLQEYFDSFRFKLTTSMKEEPKRRKPQEKKLVIPAKLGSLNPPTSPSQPSFTRRNK